MYKIHIVRKNISLTMYTKFDVSVNTIYALLPSLI